MAPPLLKARTRCKAHHGIRTRRTVRRAILRSLSKARLCRRTLAFLQPPHPTLPSSFGFADSSAIPAFSFLEEARPLFSSPPSIPGPVACAARSSIASAPRSARRRFAPRRRNRPDSVFRRRAFLRLPPTRRVRFRPPNPWLRREPVGIEPDVPSDLNLSSYSFDAEALKRDFPILRERVNGRPLVWLDNAATTQKPQSVIDRLKYFYEHENSNVHRAAHELAARATDAYESAREKVRRFLNASSTREIIFVRGATEGINLVAQSWGRQQHSEGRRDRHHLARASRQHRSLADALLGEGRAAARCAGRCHGPGPAR